MWLKLFLCSSVLSVSSVDNPPLPPNKKSPRVVGEGFWGSVFLETELGP